MKRISINKKYFLLLLGILLTGLSGCKEGGVNVVISPRSVTIPRDQQQFTFTVQVNNTQDTAVTWSIDNDNGSLGSIDPNQGIYTPPAVIPTPNTLTVSATSVADSSATDAASVTLVSGNALQFGTNTQVTDYTFPLAPDLLAPGCTPTKSCIATTSSSGQHSIKVFQNNNGPNINTFIYTVWSDNRNSTPTATIYDVFFRQITIKVDTSNTTLTQTTSLSNIVKINSVSSTDPADPSLAIDSSGFVYVAWSSGTTTNHAVYIHKSTSNPNLTSNPQVIFTPGYDIRFSDVTNCDQRAPSIATDGASVYVAWQDNRIPDNPSSCGTYNIRVARGLPPSPPPSSPPIFSPPANFPLPFTNTTTPKNQTEPSVGLFGGSLYVAWMDAQTVNHHIYFTKGPVNANITLTTPVRVNDDAGGADHTAPSLALDSLGNVYVAWQDTRNDPSPTTCSPCKNDIFFAKSINSGISFDAVPTPTNTFVPTNITEHNIRVNDDTDSANHLTPSITVENPEPNASTITPDKIYVAWQDNRNHPCPSCSLGSQIFDIITAKSVDGGNTFWTNSGPANRPPETAPTNKYNSSIAVDTFGRAYLIWTDERNNTSGTPGAASDVFFAIGQ